MLDFVLMRPASIAAPKRSGEPSLYAGAVWLLIHCTSGDLRWALAELAVRSIAAVLELGRSASVSGAVVSPKGPVWQAMLPADTMVAAGGG